MAKALENFRDTVGKALTASKKRISASLQERMGPPPAAVAGRAMKDDERKAFWLPGKGWEDPVAAQQKAAEMYAQGATDVDVMKAQFPERLGVISAGARRDDLTAQVRFCQEMVQRHMQVTAGQLQDSMAVLSGGQE